MNERIKDVRKTAGLSQASFGERLGVSRDAINNVENGRADISEILIRSICREFGVNEIWLRTGGGEMFRSRSRGEELEDYLSSVLNDRPDSFRSALVTSLLRFDPNGPEWAVLETIFNGVASAYEKETEEG